MKKILILVYLLSQLYNFGAVSLVRISELPSTNSSSTNDLMAIVANPFTTNADTKRITVQQFLDSVIKPSVVTTNLYVSNIFTTNIFIGTNVAVLGPIINPKVTYALDTNKLGASSMSVLDATTMAGINLITSNSFTGLGAGSNYIGGVFIDKHLTVSNLWVDVRTCGADDTGVSDASTAIQNAINSLSVSASPIVLGDSKPSGTVYLPSGIFVLSNSITLYPGIHLRGSSRESTIIRNMTTNTDSIKLYTHTNINTEFFRISDLTIEGRTNALDGAAINCILSTVTINPPWPVIENVFTIGHKYGFRGAGLVMGKFDNCRFNSASSHGIYITGDMASVSFNNVWAILNLGDGWNIEKATYCNFACIAAQSNSGNGYTFGTITGTHFSNCNVLGGAEGNGGIGWRVIESFNCNLHLYAYLNGSYGARLEGAKGVVLTPTLQADLGAYELSIVDGPTYGAPEGIVIMSDIISGSAPAIDNPSKTLFWPHRENSIVTFGDKVLVDAQNGSIEVGHTNKAGYPSVNIWGNNSELSISASPTNASDLVTPASYKTRIVGNYSVTNNFEIRNRAGSTNELTWLRYMSYSSPSVSIFPTSSLGGAGAKVWVGYQSIDGGAAFAVNGGASFGRTNDPGAGTVYATNNIQAAKNLLAGNKLGIGTTTPATAIHTTADEAMNQTLFDGYINSGTTPYLRPDVEFRRARGSYASPADIGTGDYMGTIGFYGYNNGNFRKAAEIEVTNPGLFDTTHVPGTFKIYVAANNADPVERLKIDSTGVTVANLGSGPVFATGGLLSTKYNIVRVDSADTTDGYLNQKIAAGANITFTTNNIGGNESITIAAIAGGASTNIYSFSSPLNLSGTNVSLNANGITDSYLRQSAGVSVVGRANNSIGDVADIVAGADNKVLMRTGGALSFTDYPDNLSIQKVYITKSGLGIGTRKQINFIEGANTTLTMSDNAGADRVDIQVSASGSVPTTTRGITYWQATGVNGAGSYLGDPGNTTNFVQAAVDSVLVQVTLPAAGTYEVSAQIPTRFSGSYDAIYRFKNNTTATWDTPYYRHSTDEMGNIAWYVMKSYITTSTANNVIGLYVADLGLSYTSTYASGTTWMSYLRVQ